MGADPRIYQLIQALRRQRMPKLEHVDIMILWGSHHVGPSLLFIAYMTIFFKTAIRGTSGIVCGRSEWLSSPETSIQLDITLILAHLLVLRVVPSFVVTVSVPVVCPSYNHFYNPLIYPQSLGFNGYSGTTAVLQVGSPATQQEHAAAQINIAVKMGDAFWYATCRIQGRGEHFGYGTNEHKG